MRADSRDARLLLLQGAWASCCTCHLQVCVKQLPQWSHTQFHKPITCRLQVLLAAMQRGGPSRKSQSLSPPPPPPPLPPRASSHTPPPPLPPFMYDGWAHDASRRWRKSQQLVQEGFRNFNEKFGADAFTLHHRFYLHRDTRGRLWLAAEDGCEGVGPVLQ